MATLKRPRSSSPIPACTITGRNQASHFPTEEKEKLFGAPSIPFTKEHFDKLEDFCIMFEFPYKIYTLSDDLQKNLDEAGIPEKVPWTALFVLLNGVDVLANKEGAASEIMEYLMTIPFDTHARNRGGKILKRHAQQSTVLADGVSFLGENGMGTVSDYLKVPHLAMIRKELATITGIESINSNPAEVNFYANTNDNGVGFHGDQESDLVYGLRCARVGVEMSLQYQWFFCNYPIGPMFQVFLPHGTLYLMSEFAVGCYWKHSSLFTLRHSAGSKKYQQIKRHRVDAAKLKQLYEDVQKRHKKGGKRDVFPPSYLTKLDESKK